MLCAVTVIAPDGRTSTAEVEARSVNRAVCEYNYLARGGGNHHLIAPEMDTRFEIEAGGTTYRTTWAKVMAWANLEAQRALNRAKLRE